MNTIGAGLNTYVEEAQNFSLINLIFTSDIYIPILMFVGLMFLSFVLKKKFFDDSI